MPKTNGIELIRWIKQRDENIKTLLLSGDDMRIVEPIATAVKADKVLTKPSNFFYLQKTIKELIS